MIEEYQAWSAAASRGRNGPTNSEGSHAAPPPMLSPGGGQRRRRVNDLTQLPSCRSALKVLTNQELSDKSSSSEEIFEERQVRDKNKGNAADEIHGSKLKGQLRKDMNGGLKPSSKVALELKGGSPLKKYARVLVFVLAYLQAIPLILARGKHAGNVAVALTHDAEVKNVGDRVNSKARRASSNEQYPRHRRNSSRVELGGPKDMATLKGSVAQPRPRVTAVVVPGGGLLADGKLPPWTKARCDAALGIFKAKPGPDRTVFVTLSQGTPHKPPPVVAGELITEAAAAARYLVSNGVPVDRVYEENVSLDTIGNAFFLRTIHLDLLRPAKVIVITSEFHLPRLKSIFEHVLLVPRFSSNTAIKNDAADTSGGTNGGSSVPSQKKDDGNNFELQFIGSPDTGLSAEVLQLRSAKEARAKKIFDEETKFSLKTLEEVHRFVFTNHMAYASKRGFQKRDELDPKLKSTY